MFSLGVRRRFIARHFMIGGDFGDENSPNSHHYLVELRIEGDKLDEHGFLVDISDIERHFDALVARYRESMLNELPEFEGLNPSLEQFARILGRFLQERIDTNRLLAMEVVLWENDSAWAAYRWGTGTAQEEHGPDRR